ncbi:MAG: 16S rRNA (uracil(1498)-N(3))-methyltransferase [Gammaproteobacteria bacterium]|nr:16S rRNA (uracil(1498)-N(3))-methyltransferase [Gammaproteobacteria bacterium]
MPLRRIYSEAPLHAGAAILLGVEAANHVVRVLRLRRGDTLVLFDGSGRDFDGEITGLERDQVRVRLGEARAVDTESPLEITLLQGICRGSRMDVVLQKATELGVRCIEPLLTERSVVRLDDGQAQRKREHWQRIAIAAAEQSIRSRLPRVAIPAAFETAIPATTGFATRLLLDPSGQSLHQLPAPASPLALLIGPEGGLTDAERRLAVDFGFQPVRLGPRILRTETAPLAAVSVLQFLCGDF